MPWEFQQEYEPATPQQLAEILQENQHAAKLPVLPIGGGTSLNGLPGQVISGIGLHTHNLTRVIDYPARDMTITVETGIRIDQLNEILKAESQCLPIDIPQSEQATLGGVLADNTSGPRRFHHGTARDFVLGVSVVDAGGQPFKSGGRVVKNVAGYDLHKLMIGSAGTLGVITQVTVKLKPLAITHPLLWASFPSLHDIDIVLEQLLTSETRPIALEVLTPCAAEQICRQQHLDCDHTNPVLIIGFEGTAVETDWQLATIQEEIAPFGPEAMSAIQDEAADNLWQALTDFQVAMNEVLTFEASVLPSKTLEFLESVSDSSIPIQAHAGNGIVIGHIAADASLEQTKTLLEELTAIQQQARGFIRLRRCPSQISEIIKDIQENRSDRPIMQEIKSALDPDGLLNPDAYFAFA